MASGFDDTVVATQLATSDSSRIEIELDDTELAIVLVVPPAPVRQRCGPPRAVEPGQCRIYNVQAQLFMPLVRGEAPMELELEATWRLIAHEVEGHTTVWSGRLDVREVSVDGCDVDRDFASELAPLHLLTFEQGALPNVEAGGFVATELVTRLARVLGGSPEVTDDSIALALIALGG